MANLNKRGWKFTRLEEASDISAHTASKDSIIRAHARLMPHDIQRAGASLIFSWYLFQLLWLATHLGPSIAPDEPYHLAISELFSSWQTYSLQPNKDLIEFGALVRYPFLAHLLMGKLTLLNIFGVSNLLYLRIVNALVAVLGLSFSWQFIKLAISSPPGRLCTLFVLVNTLMYVLMGAALSYDPWVNMLAAGSLYAFARLFRKFSDTDLLFLGLALVLGSLTKITFLPLALVLIALTAYVGRELLFTATFWKGLAKRRLNIFLSIMLIILTGLSIKLYGTNLLSFGGLYPTCDSIYGKSECTDHYNQGAAHATMERENRYTRRKFPEQFVRDYWLYMEQSAFGFIGHKARAMSDSTWQLSHRIFFMFSALSLLTLAWSRRVFFNDKFWQFCIVIWFCYGSAVTIENYMSYMKLGTFGAGLQGRYFFPAIVPFYVSIAMPIFQFRSARLCWALAAIIMIASAFGGFTFLSVQLPDEWFPGIH